MRRASFLLTLFLAVSCASADESSTSDGPTGAGGNSQGGGGGSPQPLPQLSPATGMAIGEVALYQGVKVPLYTAEGGDVATLNAPVIQGRDALLRVFFAPKADWQPHRVAVRVTLQQGQNAPQEMEIQGTPGGASSDANLNTSANFDIPAAMLDGTLSMKVEMLDVEGAQGGDTSGTLWPAEGLRALGEESTNGTFRIKVFPIRYNADGSGRVPDLGDERQKDIRYSILKTYPVTGVNLEVGEEIAWPSTVSANGNGWQQLLQKLVNLRAKDKTPNIYYYGLFMPANSMASYCSQGCVAGLTFISPGADDPSLRASIGFGYQDNQSLTTILHEVGHAHRRTHAPCGPFGQLPDQIDPSFPYKTGKIGVWGYDLIDKQLKDPSKFGDIMSYCEPTWISDYTFKALFQRDSALNQQAAYVIGKPSRWREAWLDVNNELRWGEIIERDRPPVGEEIEVVLGAGRGSRKVKGYFHGMSHLPGGLLLLPENVETTEAIDAGQEGHFEVRARH